MGWDPLLSFLGNNFEPIVSKYKKNGGDGICSNAQIDREVYYNYFTIGLGCYFSFFGGGMMGGILYWVCGDIT